MKKLLIVLLAMIALVPWNVFALESSYETKNLKDTLAAEKIEADLSDYKETDDQITIYMFRGDGCGYCQRFLKFLGSIVPDYGKYFKLVSFEVWYDTTKKNSKLMEEISEFLEEEAGGVPYIIIGDQVFPGYTSSYDESIKTAIKNEYEKSTRYDVMEEYKKYLEEMKKPEEKKETTSGSVIVFNLVFLILATGILSLVNINNTKKLEERIEELKSEIHTWKEELKGNQKVDKK